jgi:predicted ATP-binding protein involved in virulence
MKIYKIRIVDFRGIEEREFSFNSQFNVLIGENGSGKTSVLEALAAAINPYVSISQNRNVRPIRKEDVRVVNFGASIEKKVHTALFVEGEVDGRKVEWVIKKSHMDFGFMQGDDKQIRDIAKRHFANVSEDGGKNVILPVFDYLGCGRLFSEPSKSLKTLPKGSRYEGYYNCLESASSIKRFASWFKTMELSLLQGNETAKLRAQVIKRAVRNCLEGWETIFYGIEEDQLMAMRSTDKHEILPFSYLSDGQRNIIGIVADIAYRCVLLNPYLELEAAEKSPGIVLIDELDLHLHPQWQRTIVDKLKETFPNIQFITTTHSPFIVQSLKNNELIDLQGKNMSDDYTKIGLEEIVEGEMGVEGAQRSEKFLEMKRVADQYYKLILQGKNTDNSEELTRIQRQLEELMIPFYDDPAYVTYLQSFQHILNRR